ncbi:THO complex subunit 4 [Gracilaria domingensis]|nr:THO complex subunit 4 [Gracilaria domingensis]
MNPDAMLDHHDSAAPPPPYPSSFRRRPIVVRDPKTGETRLVGGGRRPASDARSFPPSSAAPSQPAPSSYRYRSGADADYDRRPSAYPPFDDQGRAPIMKIVSGYRGRQIVVRDPSRRMQPQAPAQGANLGVRGGVRKSYYDRRGTRSSPYSEEYEEDRRGDYYEEEDDDRLYSHERDADYDRDHHMNEYDRGFTQQGYYRRNRSDVQNEDEDVAGKVVFVDNLSDDVTTTGLADLFGMVGAVKELRLLYDREGNPNGSADIVFQRRADAEAAIKTLDNVPLNNRPMRLSMGNGL